MAGKLWWFNPPFRGRPIKGRFSPLAGRGPRKRGFPGVAKGSSAEVSAPSGKASAPSAEAEAPSAKVSAPSAKAQAPSAKVSAPLAEAQAASAQAGRPSAPANGLLAQATPCVPQAAGWGAKDRRSADQENDSFANPEDCSKNPNDFPDSQDLLEKQKAKSKKQKAEKHRATKRGSDPARKGLDGGHSSLGCWIAPSLGPAPGSGHPAPAAPHPWPAWPLASVRFSPCVPGAKMLTGHDLAGENDLEVVRSRQKGTACLHPLLQNGPMPVPNA